MEVAVMELLLEKFKINNKCQLNSEDISSLTLLYLPLIGLDSFSLYCALCSINQETEHQFKELVNITNISPLSNLNNAFEKLEGIGLIKSFYHKEKGYLFELVSPLKEKEFVKEEVLISLLETQI
jgi:replication initiation and membrane attachment protein